MAVLHLEVADLLVNDTNAGIIKVSKDIFDDYQPYTYVFIEFVDEAPGCIHEYIMKSEDDDGITMEWLTAYSATENQIIKEFPDIRIVRQ